jgi:drug/metabolite transporter (DMT)-like permease
MTTTSLALLLGAAFLHAAANAIMKQARDKLAFTWWMLGATVVLGLPLLAAGMPRNAAGWGLVFLSGLLEAVYFVTLSRAYSLGDLSQVYPVARGSAPLLVAVWAALILHERATPAGVAGILLIVSGLYAINLPSFGAWRRPLAGFREPAMRWALLTGVLISAYQMVDKVAVDERGPARIPPEPYAVLMLAVAWLALAGQWLHAGRRKALLSEVADWRVDGWRVVFGAVCGTGGYLLVLRALRGNPVSYIAAVREMSVVIGAWIGVQLFGERGGPVRIAASVLIACGILLIKAGG